jgi:hypothetical protein
MRLIEMYSDEGDIEKTLAGIVRIGLLRDRMYMEYIYPSPLARCLFKIIQKHGLSKVQTTFISMYGNLPYQSTTTTANNTSNPSNSNDDKTILVFTNPINQKIYKVISKYFEYAELFRIEGVNW